MSAAQGRQLDKSQLQYRSCELFFSCQIRLFFSVYIFLAHTPVLVTLRQLAGPLMVLQSGKEGVLNQEQLLQGPLQVKDQRSPFCFEFCAIHFDIRVVGYWKYTLMPTVRVEVMLGPSKTEPSQVPQPTLRSGLGDGTPPQGIIFFGGLQHLKFCLYPTKCHTWLESAVK